MLQIIRAVMKDKDDSTVCQLLFANQVISVLISVYEVLFNKHSSTWQLKLLLRKHGAAIRAARGEVNSNAESFPSKAL